MVLMTWHDVAHVADVLNAAVVSFMSVVESRFCGFRGHRSQT